MAKIETYKTTITIETGSTTRQININTSIARGWRELQSAVAKEQQDVKDISKAAKVDRVSAAGLFITREAENARAYIEAIQTALTTSEWAKIEDITPYMDIDGLRAIALDILQRYTQYYERRLKEQVE